MLFHTADNNSSKLVREPLRDLLGRACQVLDNIVMMMMVMTMIPRPSPSAPMGQIGLGGWVQGGGVDYHLFLNSILFRGKLTPVDCPAEKRKKEEINHEKKQWKTSRKASHVRG